MDNYDLLNSQSATLILIFISISAILNRGLTNHHAPTIITSPGPEYTNHHGNNYYHNNHLDNGHLGGMLQNDVFPGPPSPIGMSKSPSRGNTQFGMNRFKTV